MQVDEQVGEEAPARVPGYRPAGAAFRLRRGLTPPRIRRLSPLTAEARERWVRRRVSWIWGLLVLNALTFLPGITVIPIPGSAGKIITQGSLPLALCVALTVNRKLVIRPNVFLCVVSLLVVDAVVTSFQPQHLGTVYRTVRLAEFVVALWLLTPWWGRDDLLLLRSHLRWISVALATVVVGLLVSPGQALADGRLNGVIWPVPPTQVAHYSAVTAGVVAIMWFCGRIRGRPAALILLAEVGILILTHTRTALLGLVVGLAVGGLSLFLDSARARKLFASAVVVGTVGYFTLWAFITNWLARGEGTEDLSQLTGRTKVWGPLLSFPRNKFQEIFGFGLSNSSFNGLPIDSNWLSAYDELGLLGVAICAAILIYLIVAAFFQATGMRRALALFLVVYSLVASFTETSITDVSPYLLEVTIAASMLVPSATKWRSR
ncbi:MAG: hypothetical protein J2P26_00540 [Nocardiopsaceae bacterium]|nr:hypothetical protein [Nocardiopsaceae bacterium]